MSYVDPYGTPQSGYGQLKLKDGESIVAVVAIVSCIAKQYEFSYVDARTSRANIFVVTGFSGFFFGPSPKHFSLQMELRNTSRYCRSQKKTIPEQIAFIIGVNSAT